MASKPTPGGIWLRDQRRALGLTADALGGALGVAEDTIAAVEGGALTLAPKLRARAEAYFSRELLRKPAGPRQIPPDGLVHAEVWVRPETLTAALAEAGRSEFDVERVLGEWAGRPRHDPECLERTLVGALRSAINDHGPITPEWLGSAAKRILGDLVKARGPTVTGVEGTDDEGSR
jgi:transcriptional regulator with XRE-family HTH domain